MRRVNQGFDKINDKIDRLTAREMTCKCWIPIAVIVVALIVLFVVIFKL